MATELPPSLPFFRRREEHTECIVNPKPNNEYLIRFVKASIESVGGHKVYDTEPSFHPHDFILIKKAAILAVENYILNNDPFFCMGGLTVRFSEEFDPKYVFISYDDKEFIDRLFIYIKKED